MQKITIKGKEYPCRMTMGAMRRFKNETGKEVSDMGGDISLMGVLLWACVASACRADGVEFTDTVDDFTDKVEMDDLTQFAKQFSAPADAKKKN